LRQTKWNEIFIIIGPVIIIPIVLFFCLHLSPSMALRTHVLFNGHPIIAVSSKITKDEWHNRVDKDYLNKENATCYTITKAPKEKTTDSFLSNYIVRKKGFFYTAKYYGDA